VTVSCEKCSAAIRIDRLSMTGYSPFAFVRCHC
jgi:hypothetical protein